MTSFTVGRSKSVCQFVSVDYPRQHQATYVLKLSGVRALDIAKRWIRFHDAARHQMVQAQQVFVLAKSVQVTPAKGQRTEILRDRVQQALC